MGDIEETRRNLDIILNNGDLYDVVTKRKNKHPRTNMFFKSQILFFSRILYCGVLLGDKIKSFFAPIKKVKNAQDQIRKSLGVNADIVRSKEEWRTLKKFSFPYPKFKKELGILFEPTNLSMIEYVESLKKILTFCEVYNIDRIYLSRFGIEEIFSGIDLNDFNCCSKLDFTITHETSESGSLLFLNKEELLKLIERLNTIGVDKNVINNFKSKIEDEVVKSAIKDFNLNGNLNLLRKTIASCLEQKINNDSKCRDRDNGEVLKTVTVSGEYVKVVTNGTDGTLISTQVMTLYDYLDVVNYNGLLERINGIDDDNQLLLLTSLHIYLQQFKRVKVNKKPELSTYDQIYEKYLNKKKNFKSNKLINNYLSIMLSFFFSIMLFGLLFIAGTGFDLALSYFFNDNSNYFNKALVAISSMYKKSSEFEMNLVEEGLDAIKENDLFLDDLDQFLRDSLNLSMYAPFQPEGFGKTGDSHHHSDRTVAHIYYYNTDAAPKYFADSYATSADYSKGQITYDLNQVPIEEDSFHYGKEVVEVTYVISKKDLRSSIVDDELHLNSAIYPIGQCYGLMSIYIVDINNGNNHFSIQVDRVEESGLHITEEEKNILLSMSNPRISLTYGFNYDIKNVFVESAQKEGSYTSLLPEEAKSAITKGLNLANDATTEEIYEAIASKTYSKTPIADAGLTRAIKKMDEAEYLETIASMDSLICNLANTLAVEANDDLIYVTGYHNVKDAASTISEDESHAWAITADGEIIDVTPSSKLDEKAENKLKKIIFNVLNWADENKLSAFAIIALITAIVNHFFGDKIKLSIKVRKIEDILSKPGASEAYAKLKSYLYGGINLPVDNDVLSFLRMIDEEFEGFSKKELKELKKEIIKFGLDEDKQKKKIAAKIIDEIPYVRDNSAAIEAKLSRKKRS